MLHTMRNKCHRIARMRCGGAHTQTHTSTSHLKWWVVVWFMEYRRNLKTNVLAMLIIESTEHIEDGILFWLYRCHCTNTIQRLFSDSLIHYFQHKHISTKKKIYFLILNKYILIYGEFEGFYAVAPSTIKEKTMNVM